jgi:hypothetical protein
MRHDAPQNLDPPTEEDAFSFLARFLRNPINHFGSSYGYDIYLTQVFHGYFVEMAGVTPSDSISNQFSKIAPQFLAAAWEMCRRGILRPGVVNYNRQSTDEGHAGFGFSITPAGHRWLKEAGDRYDYVPIEPGRFSSLLAAYESRFGSGYLERSQEAIRCYGAHSYLACCAMCGAAAESIFLAVAIAKAGDSAKIEKMYLGSGGRGRVEKFLVGSLTPAVADEFKGYVSLLKYWRDSAAHGMKIGIRDAEAYTALAILLRFAQFTNDRWAELSK